MSPSSVVRERPILFSAPMVRAILAGTKTQTRRVVRHAGQTVPSARSVATGVYPIGELGWFVDWPRDYGTRRARRCPYGGPGDRLWVRETFCPAYFDGGRPGYRADYDASRVGDVVPEPTWKPSIFMPRALSRITLEVTEVCVERVQAITEEDARAEGVRSHNGQWCGGPHPIKGTPKHFPAAKDGYRDLWDSINAKRPGCAWADNPWVWVVSFRRLEVAHAAAE